MNITGVRVTLSGEDILSFIKQWLNVPGLVIEEVIINEFIQIRGVYKTLIKIPFNLLVAVGSIQDNNINMSIISLKLGKIKIFSFIKNKISKKIVEDLEQEGITYNEDIIVVDLKKLLNKLPIGVNVTLNEIILNDSLLICTTENIKISLIKEQEDEKVEEKIEIQEKVEKVNDCYTKVKGFVEEKGGGKYSGVMKYAFIVPDLIALLVRLLKDRRVPLKSKISVMISLGYIFSPFDLIPDSVPFIGGFDDMAVAFFALNKIINNVPHNIILENWSGEDDVIELIQEGVNYVYTVTNGVKINRIYEALDKLF